ncbi:hypothetical protein [Tenacibaculum finnmarkense]|nr:hypothetical protein [Tenacibaculum finnmarkense]
MVSKSIVGHSTTSGIPSLSSSMSITSAIPSLSKSSITLKIVV